MANTPRYWFIPSENIPHPETREMVLRKDTAYSLWALTEVYRETGIDYCPGEVVTLYVARQYWKSGKITSYRQMRGVE